MTREEHNDIAPFGYSPVPCAHCGGKGVICETEPDVDGIGECRGVYQPIHCPTCNYTLHEEIWNRRAPQPLKVWTKKDGTPPDGYYLSAMNLSGELIEIDGDCFYWAEDAGEELGQAYTRRLWEAFSVLYRLPIDPANGEPRDEEIDIIKKYECARPMCCEDFVPTAYGESKEEARDTMGCEYACCKKCKCDGPIEIASGEPGGAE